MRVPYVLHLDPDQLTEGRLSGEIEEVQTARTAAVRSAEDIVVFCCGSDGGKSRGRGEQVNE